MALNYEHSFEIRPGKLVFLQRDDAKKRGAKALKSIQRLYKPSSIFFHIGRRGGHVAAMRLHRKSDLFSRFDVADFFGAVTRAKIVRSLRKIGMDNKSAFDIAVDAVVVRGGVKSLPFGFLQSPLLATLVFERSALGATLKRISADGLLVSVYMDDILVSSDDEVALRDASRDIAASAAIAGLPLSLTKIAIATEGADIFNCHIEDRKIALQSARMDLFVQAHRDSSAAGQAAIERYVGAVSTRDLAILRRLV